MVGLPMNAVLDWPMGTPSGWAVFLDPHVNAMLRKVLNAWGEYLSSESAEDVLGDNQRSWLSGDGIKELEKTASVGETTHKSEELFQCDPSKPHYGFKSWDDFFTRPFREEVR